MRRRSHNHLILMSILFWVLAIGGVFAYVTQGSAAEPIPGEEASQLVAQQCIENALPAISRGAADREAAKDVIERSQADGQGAAGDENAAGALNPAGEGGRLTAALRGMVDRTFPFLTGTAVGDQPDDENGSGSTKDETPDDSGQLAANAGQALTQAAVTKDTTEEAKAPEVPVLDTEESKEPLVLIYHTHATESYQPVSVGNFHSTTEEGTVREVGNELTKALEAKGIPVIHDKTLHDNPSYNASYGRSLETVKSYLAKNPSIKIVIDLHRDAAGYSGGAGKTTTIGGNKVATYSLVVGKGNANVDKLHLFAKRINEEAEKLYPGLAGRVIDKEYRFNQYVCDRYMLLEVGNNENTIDQVKLTGKYFADVLEAYLKDYPPN